MVSRAWPVVESKDDCAVCLGGALVSDKRSPLKPRWLNGRDAVSSKYTRTGHARRTRRACEVCVLFERANPQTVPTLTCAALSFDPLLVLLRCYPHSPRRIAAMRTKMLIMFMKSEMASPMWSLLPHAARSIIACVSTATKREKSARPPYRMMECANAVG